MNLKCANCGADASGKFCASCGAPLEGAACAVCRSPLTPGAKFCHRCGSPAGAGVRSPDRPTGGIAALPWAVAAIALLALISLAAGQRFSRAPQRGAELTTPMGTPMQGSGRAPDISQLTPAERAERLYDRIMGAAERGRADTVQFFMPMALQAYQALGPLNIDQRYDLGRLAEVAGDLGVGHGDHAEPGVLDLHLDRGADDLADAPRQFATAGRVGHRTSSKGAPPEGSGAPSGQNSETAG